MKIYKHSDIYVFVLTILMVVVLVGCVATESNFHYRGVERSDLKQIDCGTTTREQLVAIAGEPTEQSMAEDGTEVLRYKCSEKKNSSFVLSAPSVVIKDTKEKEYTIAFELKDGIVQRHWKEK